MKKLILTLIISSAAAGFSYAQVLPSFQLGIKGGVDLVDLNHSATTFSTSNQAGYLAGIWARVGALGFNFQPELYVTGKDVEVSNNNGGETKAKFTSIDMPLLFGGKVGAFGVGVRFYTGPLVSFAINKDQNFGGAVDKAVSLDYKDQNFAWQLGGGLDIKDFSVDLRYEAGITKQTYGYSHTRVSLFNLSLAYSLFKL